MASSPTATSNAGIPQLPSSFKIIGIILAIVSGVLIGSSFVFKKKGLLRASMKSGNELGEGVAYLKSPMWWTGMTMMILGEFCNFAAYAFVPAVIVTPLGALSVVICAVLSSFFLNETLTFFGWVGCFLCIVGSVIIALNGPQEATVGQIKDFEKLFLGPAFLVFGGLLIATSLAIIIYFIPRYGKKNMLWCIMVCSMIGGLSVSTTTGLGGAIVTTLFLHDNQFKNFFIYILIVFVICTLLTEVYYLNMALALFNTAMVTPTYYVIFTGFTLVTSVVLFKGLSATVPQILTLVMGFLVICAGITVLQMSKIDPKQLKKLDRRSTMLLQASRTFVDDDESGEKMLSKAEDPGMDALRGSFGALGSIVRAKSVKHLSRSLSTMDQSGLPPRRRHGAHPPRQDGAPGDIQRHQLYDAPVQPDGLPETTEGIRNDAASISTTSLTVSSPPPRSSTIKFGDEDIEHYYPSSRKGNDRLAPVHQSRALSSTSSILVRHDRTPSPSPNKATEGETFGDPASGTGHGTFKTSFTDPFNVTIQSPPTTPRRQPASNDDRTPTRTHARTGSKSPQQLIPRTPRSARQYPSSSKHEDREQSVSLVHDLSETEGEVDQEDDAGHESAEDEMLRNGGIRLLSTTTRI